MNPSEALDRVRIPVLLISGWQDLFIDQTLVQYDHLQRRGGPVARRNRRAMRVVSWIAQ